VDQDQDATQERDAWGSASTCLTLSSGINRSRIAKTRLSHWHKQPPSLVATSPVQCSRFDIAILDECAERCLNLSPHFDFNDTLFYRDPCPWLNPSKMSCFLAIKIRITIGSVTVDTAGRCIKSGTWRSLGQLNRYLLRSMQSLQPGPRIRSTQEEVYETRKVA
jgi:hypothetical protein